MERRKFLQHAGLTGILAASQAPAIAGTLPALRWRLASSFPRSLDTIFGASEVFAQKIREMTGGRFEISIHAAGELMPPFGVVDAVQAGTVECAHTAPYYFFGKDETFAINCAIPFGLNSRQMTAWMTEGNGLKLFREFYRHYNIVNFPMGNTGVQMGGWYRKPLHALSDIKGMKMRIGGFGGKVLERLGGIPQNIPGGEIYQALEKGAIDAVEWVGPYDDQKLGFHPAWWEGGPELELYINSRAWDALPADYRAMIECATALAHTDMQAKYDARNPKALRELVASGVTLTRMPKDVMDAAFKASMALYDELSAKNPHWRKIYTDYATFRQEQNQWFRFAEASFDSYMRLPGH